MTAKDGFLGSSLLDLLSTTQARAEIATIGHTAADAYVRFYENDDPDGNAYTMGIQNSSFVINKLNDEANTVLAVGTVTPTITRGLEVNGDINYTGQLLKDGEISISSQWTTSNIIDGPNIGSNAIVYTAIDGLVGIGTDYPLGQLHVEGDIYFSGSLIQNGEEFVGGGGGANNISSGSNFAYKSMYAMTNTISGRTIRTNAASVEDRTLYAFSLTPGRYMITANVPYMNMDGITLLDNSEWATICLYQAPVVESSILLGSTSMRINSDKSVVTQPLHFVIEVKKYANYAIVVNGRGQTLKFGSTLHDNRLRIIPIVLASLPQPDMEISVIEALQVNPAKSMTRISGGPQSVFTFSQEGYFTATPTNTGVYLNGTKYAYVSSTQKDYDLFVSYLYDSGNNVTSTIYTVTLEEPAVNGDIVDITVNPVATADTLFSSGFLYQKIETTFQPGWNSLLGGSGIRSSATKVIIDGDLIVQGGIFGGSNVSGYAIGERYDVTNTTGPTVEWVVANPALDLRPGAGGAWSTTAGGSSNVTWIRYAGNEVMLSMTIDGTVITPATSSSSDWRLTLPYPMNTIIYSNGGVLGDMLVKLTVGTNVNTYKAYCRIDTAEPDALVIRYLTGTSELGLGSLATGTKVVVSGNLTYSTMSMTGGVPVNFLPPDLRQDELGRIGVNIGVGAVRAQLDVITTSTLPALVADTQSRANALEARVGGVQKFMVDANGMVGINMGGIAPTSQLHVIGNARVEGNLIVNGTQTNLDIINSSLVSTNKVQISNNSVGPALLINQIGAHPVLDIQDDGITMMTMVNGGNVGFGTLVPQQKIHVVGNTQVTGNMFANKTFSGADSASAPGFSWSADSNTGIYRPAADVIGLVTGGSERLRIDSTGYVTGSVSGLPSIYPAMQFYRLIANIVGLNTLSAQKVLGKGVTVLGGTQYEFQATYFLTKASGGVAHQFGLGFGGTATITNIAYTVNQISNPAFNAVNTSGIFAGVTQATNTLVTSSLVGSAMTLTFALSGSVTINTGGTFIPQYTLSSLPGGAYTTVAGSYFKMWPIGSSSTNASIGTWA